MNGAGRVYVEKYDTLVSKMFRQNGWSIARDLSEANLLCLVGGPDITPMLYGSMKHPRSITDPKRDESTWSLYKEACFKMPIVGICRGAQFINVMNGGYLYQDIDNHSLGKEKAHEALCEESGKVFPVTSTHHQMMLPGKNAKILMTAYESDKREFDKIGQEDKLDQTLPDIEAVIYENTQSLCYQPHPEYVPINHPCRKTFFNYLNLLLKKRKMN